MRTNLVIIILAMALVGVVLVMVTGAVYRNLALENQHKLLADILELGVLEQLEDAERHADAFGRSLQAGEDFRQALAQGPRARLETVLAQSVGRDFAAYSGLDIKRMTVFDRNYRPVADLEVAPMEAGGADPPCPALIEQAKRVSDDFDVDSTLCQMNGRGYLVTLVGIDGGRQGYVRFVTDPVLNIRKIEKLMGMPLLIGFGNGREAYRSQSWRDVSGPDTAVRVDHSLKAPNGEEHLFVSLVFDVAGFSYKLERTEAFILAGAGVITLVAVLIALSLLQRNTLSPLGLLTRQLRLLREDKEHLGEQVQVAGNKELCQLATDFNAVSSELKDVYQKLERLAFTDSLTGLPNRELFYERLRQLILLMRLAPSEFSLFVMDLDRFKLINDTLGHHVGDELLCQAGARIDAAVREMNTIARLGGDEFAVLLPKVVDRQGAIIVVGRIHAALSEPFIIDGHHLHAGVSIGVVMYPYHGENQHELVQRAEVAMYHAKRNQMGFAFYEAQIDKHDVLELTLETELKHAIHSDALKLFYQPKIMVDSGEVYGVEALLRWNHPQRGFIPPDSFIPMAEQTGLIHPLTQWVLKTAVNQVKAWHDRGLMLNVAINLSAQSLRDPSLVDTIEAALTGAGLAPHHLTLELTETAVMSDPCRALDILTELDQKGVMLSIDDFGTGYSSLAYLKQLPMDELKIDRSFVMEMDKDKNDAVIVHSTIDLAHNMGLKVVAEGVETDQSWHTLKALGCDMGQGYHLCKPVEPDSLMEWLDSSDWRAPC